MGALRLPLVLVLIVGIGIAGFFVGRLLINGGEGTKADDPSVSDRLDAIQTQEAAKREEPRFAGELLGIYIASSIDQVPRQVLEEDERVRSGGCEVIPAEEASEIYFARPLELPADYILADQGAGFAETGTNPWAEACGGKAYLLGWGYNVIGAEGIPATVTIVRSLLRYDTQDVAESQVSTQDIAGREAIVIRPISPSGLGQRTLIYFPEPFGATSIHTFNLPEAEALKVAEAVAASSR
jgi:hypothetical protein